MKNYGRAETARYKKQKKQKTEIGFNSREVEMATKDKPAEKRKRKPNRTDKEKALDLCAFIIIKAQDLEVLTERITSFKNVIDDIRIIGDIQTVANDILVQLEKIPESLFGTKRGLANGDVVSIKESSKGKYGMGLSELEFVIVDENNGYPLCKYEIGKDGEMRQQVFIHLALKDIEEAK